MTTTTTDAGAVELHSGHAWITPPIDPVIAANLRRGIRYRIPWQHRRWNRQRCAWLVNRGNVDVLAAVVARYAPEVPVVDRRGVDR